MKTLASLNISARFIALFGSGNSVLDLSPREFDFIKSKAFTVTINYAPVHLKGHLNMWSDLRVSGFLEDHYRQNAKETLFLAQRNKVSGRLKAQVDYWFSRKGDGLKGNYTIVWALQLLKQYFPDKTILLFGVDLSVDKAQHLKWYDRYTTFDREKRGKRYNAQSKLNQCARQLQLYCPREGIFNCNLQSRLDHFEKRDWRSFFPLKILHLCSTPLAGAPAHLSRIINKYSTCESISVLKADFKAPGLRNLRWEYDEKGPNSRRLKELAAWADLIHHHRRVYPGLSTQQPNLLQYHAPPAGYVPRKTQARFNGRKMVIAQYHPRFYTDAFIVPNLIDIWEAMYLPEKKSMKQVKIFYSWATEVKGGWADKGSAATKKILSRIKNKYGDQVKICILHNHPYEACMAEKRTAHICIDECVTGSYHLQSLEGCSVGAVTFNNIDEQTLSFLTEVTGQATHPFVQCPLEHLFDQLCYYIDHPEKRRQKGLAARTWMETHWDPRKLVHRYIRAYFNVLLHGKIQISTNRPILTPAATSTPKTQSRKSSFSPFPKKSRYPTRQPALTSTSTVSASPGFNIEALYKKYHEKDIFIFGTGPSLLRIDPERYKDKLCFGINFAFEHMPYLDYHLVHVIETYDVIRKVVDNQKLILPETLVRQWYRERHKNIRPQRIPTQNEHAFLYPIQHPTERKLDRKHTSLKVDTRFFTWSSTTHSAIHIAAYMGARNIYLIGMDYELFPGGKVHFESKYSPIYSQQNWNANQKHRQGDEWLCQQLASQGIVVKNLSREISNQQSDVHQRNHQSILQG